jgi:hypothetical protein
VRTSFALDLSDPAEVWAAELEAMDETATVIVARGGDPWTLPRRRGQPLLIGSYNHEDDGIVDLTEEEAA